MSRPWLLRTRGAVSRRGRRRRRSRPPPLEEKDRRDDDRSAGGLERRGDLPHDEEGGEPSEDGLERARGGGARGPNAIDRDEVEREGRGRPEDADSGGEERPLRGHGVRDRREELPSREDGGPRRRRAQEGVEREARVPSSLHAAPGPERERGEEACRRETPGHAARGRGHPAVVSGRRNAGEPAEEENAGEDEPQRAPAPRIDGARRPRGHPEEDDEGGHVLEED